MRKEKIVSGHYYHIYNRGVNYQPIFFGRGNYIFFLQRLREYLLGEDRKLGEDRDRNRVLLKTWFLSRLTPNKPMLNMCVAKPIPVLA